MDGDHDGRDVGGGGGDGDHDGRDCGGGGDGDGDGDHDGGAGSSGGGDQDHGQGHDCGVDREGVEEKECCCDQGHFALLHRCL